MGVFSSKEGSEANKFGECDQKAYAETAQEHTDHVTISSNEKVPDYYGHSSQESTSVHHDQPIVLVDKRIANWVLYYSSRLAFSEIDAACRDYFLHMGASWADANREERGTSRKAFLRQLRKQRDSLLNKLSATFPCTETFFKLRLGKQTIRVASICDELRLDDTVIGCRTAIGILEVVNLYVDHVKLCEELGLHAPDFHFNCDDLHYFLRILEPNVSLNLNALNHARYNAGMDLVAHCSVRSRHNLSIHDDIPDLVDRDESDSESDSGECDFVGLKGGGESDLESLLGDSEEENSIQEVSMESEEDEEFDSDDGAEAGCGPFRNTWKKKKQRFR